MKHKKERTEKDRSTKIIKTTEMRISMLSYQAIFKMREWSIKRLISLISGKKKWIEFFKIMQWLKRARRGAKSIWREREKTKRQTYTT